MQRLAVLARHVEGIAQSAPGAGASVPTSGTTQVAGGERVADIIGSYGKAWEYRWWDPAYYDTCGGEGVRECALHQVRARVYFSCAATFVLMALGRRMVRRSLSCLHTGCELGPMPNASTSRDAHGPGGKSMHGPIEWRTGPPPRSGWCVATLSL